MGATWPAARLLGDFSDTFEDFPVGMAAVSADARVLRANAALCDLLGRSESDLVGLGLGEWLAPDDGAPAPTLADLAAPLLLRGRCGDGVQVPVLVHRTGVQDAAGTVVLLIEPAPDAGQAQHAERRLIDATARAEALVRLSDALSGDTGRDAHRACELVADAVHEVLGGGVTVWRREGPADGALEAVAVRTDDPAAEAELRRLYAQVPARTDVGYLGEACRSAQPLLVRDPWRDVPPAMLEFLPWLRAHPVRSLLVVPLLAGGRVLGVLGVGSFEESQDLTGDDVAFAAQVGRRLAVLLSDAHLLAVNRSSSRRDRSVAEVIRRVDEALHDPGRLLDAAARAVADQVDGACVLWLADPDDADRLGRGAVAHRDPALEAVISKQLVDAPLDERSLVHRVLAEGRASLVGEEQVVAHATALPGLSEHAHRLGLASLYGVRLLARGSVLGALLVGGISGPLTVDDRRLVDALADRLALAIDNASLLAAARASQQRARALVEHCSDMLLLADGEGRITYASPAAARTFGGALGQTLMTFVVPEDRGPVRDSWFEALRRPGPHPAVDVRVLDVSGRQRRLSAVANNLLDDPSVDGVVLTVRDVTDEREASERLGRRAAQQAALATIGATALTASLHELFWFVGSSITETLSTVSSGVGQLLDDGSWLVLGGSDRSYDGADVRLTPSSTSGMALVARRASPVVVDDYAVPGEVVEPEVVDEYGLRSGVLVPVLVHGKVWGVVTAHSEAPGAFSAVDVDFLSTVATVLAGAVERAGFAERVLQQATTDALTGLPNRVHLSQRLAGLLVEGRAVALLLLDLDDFKDVNDSLGHGAGDSVLTQLARRLDDVAAGRGALSRLGGDEFAFCLEGCDDPDAAVRAAEEVVRTVNEPFALPGIDVTLSGSIGIAMAPEHGTVPERLLQAADMAMYRAKGERSGWALFDNELDGERSERLTLLSELRLALSAGQLELHYQPLVDLRTDAVVEVEALVRWQHPERGLLLPGAFLPMAEQTDLVHGLTRYVVRAAVRQAREWRAQGWPGTVAVNISAHALRPPSVVEALREELLRGEGCLTVELTESALVDERAREAVETLAAAGISCSVDDFGTGWSSLAYLRELPVRRLKLDRAFNRDVDRDERDAAIVGGVVTMAHAIGLDVVAEGVETQAVAERLRGLGVDVAQGWLYGRPQPASSLRLV